MCQMNLSRVSVLSDQNIFVQMDKFVDYTPLTTKQAARLIHVHESSVKRWCREGLLPFDVTDGGHRRIALKDLLDFAARRKITCSISKFPDSYREVWRGLRGAQSRKNYDILCRLAYAWLTNPANDLFDELIRFCLEQNLPFEEVFDDVIARALRKMGSAWQNNELNIGIEHYATERIRDVMHKVRIENERSANAANGQSSFTRKPLAVVGCNAGNQHDIGAFAIRIILEQKGWETIYLGSNVPANDFGILQARHSAQLVCISFVSQSIMSESERFVDLLARFYDPNHPYHLAIGSQTFPVDASNRLRRSPFLGVNTYKSTLSFNQWLDSHPVSVNA